MLTTLKHFGYKTLRTYSGNPGVKITELNQYSMSHKKTFHVLAGKIKGKIEQNIPSTNDDGIYSINTELTNYHKKTFVAFCSDQKQCHNRQCDTTHESICPHKAGSFTLSMELGGGLTHKIPSNKPGVLLSSHDANGDANPQYMVTETSAVPVKQENIVENQKVSEYLQDSIISEKIKRALPPNSALLLKDTSINHTTLDEHV